jgi:OmcA/MtrC family decaheme c-type cytochrome
VNCHGPGDGLNAQAVHVVPDLVAAERFRYEVLNVANSAPGQQPTVTIRVTDPTNNNAPYDIKAAGGPFQVGNAALRVDLAWSTRPDFTNNGSGSATPVSGTPAQPITIDFKANGVPNPAFPGGFMATAAKPIPLDATGSGSALLEGRPNVDTDGDGDVESVPVTAAGLAFAITDASAMAYRQVVDINKCNDCHKQLSLHGDNRAGNPELCSSCHNPNATDINRRVAGTACETVTGTLDDQSIDFKYMVHAIHAGPIAGYKVCGHNSSGYDFSHVTYPGKLNNCEGCHTPQSGTSRASYHPVDPAVALPTTFDAGADRSTALDDRAVSPNATVCSACHADAESKAHMEINGGSFNLTKNANGTQASGPVETCGICHGPGRTYDVKQMHKVGEFAFN